MSSIHCLLQAAEPPDSMYAYDELDQSIVEQRSAEFRAQVQRRLEGKISEAEFKPLRLMNGLYLQLHAYMLRVAIPYGVLNSKQLYKLADIADKYDRGYGHFTTRQNIQYNWPKLVETPDILDELASVQMHAIQTSGNCIRNITSDPFAGVAADEEFDPRPLSELLRQWSTLHPEFAYLPRKFKFAITGSAIDRAAIKVHDIGLRVKRGPDDQIKTDIWVGGGQGRTPKIAQLFKSDVTIEVLLPYLEAIMRVYNRYGRRDNKYKARIKILLAETGIETLQQQVEAEYQKIDKEDFSFVSAELARITAHFSGPEYTSTAVASDAGSGNPDFSAWKNQNVKPHKQAGYAIAMVSLKPAGGIPGDATSKQMRAVADIAKQYSHDELRVTHRQNLVLPHIQERDMYAVWKALVEVDLAEGNIDLPSDIIACPGLDYCALATARSIPIAQAVSAKIRQVEKNTDLSGVSVNISGCINACAHHHVASIGVLGLNKGGVENYQLTLGGRHDENASIGERLGPGVAGDEVPLTIERIVNFYTDVRNTGESLSDTYDRVGKEAFKEAAYV